MAGLTIGVWALILGIPLFLFISAIITYVDRLVNGEEETPV
jgi:predicted PurR-regulated permease PerM